MKRLAILAIVTLIVGCSTSDNEEPNYPPRGRGPMGGPMGGDGGYGSPRATTGGGGGGLDMLPPGDWWHQPQIADAVKLTADQVAALDKLPRDEGDDTGRLQRDSLVAIRDLRNVLESNQPTSSDITTAAQRIRALHDSIFDRQVQMLVAERLILTQQQWQTLQQKLQERRSERMQEGYPRRGGRGMGGGRGRRPGF